MAFFHNGQKVTQQQFLSYKRRRARPFTLALLERRQLQEPHGRLARQRQVTAKSVTACARAHRLAYLLDQRLGRFSISQKLKPVRVMVGITESAVARTRRMCACASSSPAARPTAPRLTSCRRTAAGRRAWRAARRHDGQLLGRSARPARSPTARASMPRFQRPRTRAASRPRQRAASNHATKLDIVNRARECACGAPRMVLCRVPDGACEWRPSMMVQK